MKNNGLHVLLPITFKMLNNGAKYHIVKIELIKIFDNNLFQFILQMRNIK